VATSPTEGIQLFQPTTAPSMLPVVDEQSPLPTKIPTPPPVMTITQHPVEPIVHQQLELATPGPTQSPVIPIYQELANCKRRKILIVHLKDEADFSSRMMAVISSAQLAVLLKRPLMIHWDSPLGKRNGRFDEIFYGKSHPTFALGNSTFFDALPLKQTGRQCTLDFKDDRETSTAVLAVPSLFSRTKDECDFLVIKNVGEYFADLLIQLKSESNEAKLMAVFTGSPLHHITNCVFNFQPRLKKHMKILVNRLAASGPYLTLYAKEGTTQASLETAFQCINEMIKQHTIKIMYLITDTLSTSELARQYISDPSKIFSGAIPSTADAGGIDESVKEIYLTSHSDYCATTSLNSTSPISQVAMASGPCIYIDVSQGSR